MCGQIIPSLLSLTILLLAVVQGEDETSHINSIELEVFNDPSGSEDLPGTLKLIEGATLNITCRVASPEEESGEVNLSWYLPNNFIETRKRFEQTGKDKTSTLVISPVIQTDTGDYECWARHKGDVDSSDEEVKKVLKVMIEPRRGSCQSGQYQCEGQEKYCIATRYRCDRHDDCPLGDDENPMFCGHEPCKGKIVCPDLDFRCIDPTEYCCDPNTDPACTFMYPCCEPVMEFSLSRNRAQYAKQQYDSVDETNKDRRDSELAYLHSTVYTIIGCAVAFLVIVLTLGLAICRLHIQRKATGGRRGVSGLGRGGGRSHPPLTLQDIDIYFSSGDRQAAQGDEGGHHIEINYNINHGLQIMRGGSRVPPPYSTSPRRGANDPPPPYVSSENVANEPLLGEQEDDNNNGDINGNSEMVDNNAPVVQRQAEQVAEVSAESPPRYPGVAAGREGSSSSSSTDNY